MDNNYIVSARKYRPSTFHSVVGQKALTTTLKNAIQNNKLAHAYLFCGPRGVGKTTCARIFAKTINCMNPQADGEACNQCESCKAFNENRSYNVYELDAASNNTGDDIRSLTDQVRIPPQIGRYKVYIIDEVHMLSMTAFNAFLKTLEEPPHHVVFILATTEKHKIIPTILSRCQIYDFSRITINDIVDHLEYVAKSENVTVEREALNTIAQKADGGMRDALSIFDQVVSFSGGNVTYQSVIANLNVLDYDYYFRLTDSLLAGNIPKSLLILDEIIRKGFDGQHIVSGLANFFRDIMVCKDPQTLVLFEVGDAVKEKYTIMAQKCTTDFLYKALEWGNECDLNYRYSKNKRLLIEILLIRLCQFNHQSSPVDDKKKIKIEPLVAAEENGQPEKSATITTQQVSHSEQTVQSNQPNQPQPNNLSGNNKLRFSLKQPVESSSNENIPTEQIQQIVVLDKPFTQEDLVRVWKNYAETEESDAHLKNTVLNILPQIGEQNKILVETVNPDQQQKLKDKSASIQAFLSQQLQNNQISLAISLIETGNATTPYAGKEIYQFMAEKHPAIIDLVNEFNLKLTD
ncbi:MAG: DNA polymerase III subunit gamma/tau [Candidatus Symbiothrix sp.]|jgi:DNA polymerase-3 subunit gamma/tau|nr:DNA polymerase III subunit gamma/tau [Candidatus Symbiothrix sp.]